MSRRLPAHLLLLLYISCTATGLSAQQHPDWIPARPDDEAEPEADSTLTTSAQTILTVQAQSAEADMQLEAINGIRELINLGNISADDPGAIEILYQIAAQSFLQTERPAANRLSVRLQAIQALALGGRAAAPHLFSIIQRDPDPTAAAEAAYALSGHDINLDSQRIIAERLRVDRLTSPNDRLAHSLLLLVLQKAKTGYLTDQLIDEIIRVHSGPYIRNVKLISAQILQILSDKD
ncbi:MAG: hypothetical protein ACOCVC_08110 [Spirochaeta sp.]